MKDLRIILSLFFALQMLISFGQAKFRLGKYEMNHEQINFKADSTFEYSGSLGCFGSTSSTGKFSVREDTLILDTGIPIVWNENKRNDDSLIINIRDVTTDKPIPNVRVAFKFIPKTNNYLSTDNRGQISIVRQRLDSVFIDREVIKWYNDSAMMKLFYTFFDNSSDGKYRIENSGGVDLEILVNFQLLDKFIILNKEKWIIIDANNIFEPRRELGLTFTRIEK